MENLSMDQIKARNAEVGHHFFEAGALRFFRSRIGKTVYQGPGGIYFVTSEQFVGSNGYTAPRRYSVRRFDPSTGAVDSAGPFNELGKSAANSLAKRLALGSEVVSA